MVNDSDDGETGGVVPSVLQGGDRTAGQGVLNRLLRDRHLSRRNAGEAPGMPQHVPASPARAAATAVSRAAEDLYGLPLQPLSIVPDAITLAEMSEILPESALFALVEGAGEALGVVAMDPAAVTALVEVQALGRITNRPIENRRRTRSDAFICAEFVNRMLSELETEMVGMEGFESFSGFRFVSHLDDSRPLLLMLEDVGYRSLRMMLSMGDDIARREVQFVIALPERRAAVTRPLLGRDLSTPPLSVKNAPVGKATELRPGPDLSAMVAGASVDLVGVLCRRQLRLAEVQALLPGKLLALPRVSLHDARLETAQGQVVAQGKLGEADGCHAIRLRRRQEMTEGALHTEARTDAFSAHALAEPPMRPVTGPGSAWHPGQPPQAARAGEPPMGDLGKADQFRDASAMAGLAISRLALGTTG